MNYVKKLPIKNYTKLDQEKTVMRQAIGTRAETAATMKPLRWTKMRTLRRIAGYSLKVQNGNEFITEQCNV